MCSKFNYDFKLTIKNIEKYSCILEILIEKKIYIIKNYSQEPVLFQNFY